VNADTVRYFESFSSSVFVLSFLVFAREEDPQALASVFLCIDPVVDTFRRDPPARIIWTKYVFDPT
jgi:hypothetical protein